MLVPASGVLGKEDGLDEGCIDVLGKGDGSEVGSSGMFWGGGVFAAPSAGAIWILPFAAVKADAELPSSVVMRHIIANIHTNLLEYIFFMVRFNLNQVLSYFLR